MPARTLSLRVRVIISLLFLAVAGSLLSYRYASTSPNIHRLEHYGQPRRPEADLDNRGHELEADDRDSEFRHREEDIHPGHREDDREPHRHGLAIILKPKTNMTKRKTQDRPTPRNFVLAESYWEEMTMATHNFMGLVTVAKHWNARAVMPFTARSYLNGIKGPYTWDLLYDLNDIKQKLAEMSLPAPVRFEDFLKIASRHVVSIIIDWKNGGGTNRCSKLQEEDMYSKINFLNAKLETVAPRFRQETCCVVYSQPIVNGIVEIAEKCGLKNRAAFTVIFKEWRGTTSNKRQADRVSMPYNSATKFPVHFNHSKWVIKSATLFFKDITQGSGKCIAVHIRAEVLIRDHITNVCLTNLNQISTHLRTNYTDLPFLVFGDEELSKIQNRISNGVVVRFNPKKYKAVADRGFTAQVEQHTMSLCQILVQVGGGSFQARTLARFNTEPSHLFSVRACGH